MGGPDCSAVGAEPTGACGSHFLRARLGRRLTEFVSTKCSPLPQWRQTHKALPCETVPGSHSLGFLLLPGLPPPPSGRSLPVALLSHLHWSPPLKVCCWVISHPLDSYG